MGQKELNDYYNVAADCIATAIFEPNHKSN